MKDSRFPWLVLVPEWDSVREIHELPPADRAELIEEIALASKVLARLFRPDKLTWELWAASCRNSTSTSLAAPPPILPGLGRSGDQGRRWPMGQGELEEIRGRVWAAFQEG